MRGPPPGRLPEWPDRLAALITAAEHRPFDAVRWNCGRFAMAAVVACTGQRPSWQHRPTLAEIADTAGYPRAPVPFARTGDVVLAANPDRLTELGRFTPLADKTWNHPVVVQGRLYVRNDRELACFDLGPAPPAPQPSSPPAR